MGVLIQSTGVTKYYNRHRPNEVRALNNITLSIQQGEFLVLNGASGSGKTTLLGHLGCMVRPTSGSIFVQDQEISKLPERFLTSIRRKSFGFIFQQFNLIRGISVRDNILLPLFPENIKIKEMNERCERIMESLQIKAKSQMKITELSGGEQQRVAIARALINEPSIIIADEPTAHLDSGLSEDLLGILGNLNDEGKTIIVATHDPFVSEHPLVTRSVRMRDGQIVNEERG